MDPSIMKLLEEDEDESMHSGADVDAFQAALNRDIGGDGSMSQPPDSGTVFSQESNQTSSQPFSTWPTAMQDENSGGPSPSVQQQQQQPQERHTSTTELKQHGSVAENQQQQNDVTRESNQQGQAEQVSVQNSQTIGSQISEKSPVPVSESDKIQKIGNQQAVGMEQAGNMKNQGKQIPFVLLLPALKPHLDKDREMQLQTLFNKLRKNDIPKEQFVRLMRSVVGDQVLRMAVAQLQSQSGATQSQLQSQALARQHPARIPVSSSATQFTDPHSFGLHQKASNSAADLSRNATSAVQMQADSSFQSAENNAQKSREVERQPDSHGMQVSQIPSSSASMIGQEREHSSISMPGNKQLQQQQHPPYPQNSFPMYGSSSGNYHPYSGANANTSASTLKQQPHDLQMRQVSHHQSMGTAQLGGSTQAMNMVSVPTFERQNSGNDPNRVQGGSVSHYANKPALQTSAPFSSVNYVKQEPVEQATEQQLKSQLSTPPVEQGNVIAGNSRDDSLDKQPLKVGFTPPTGSVPSNSVSSSVAPHLDPNVQVASRIPSAPSPAAMNARTPPKKPSVGQKKPHEAISSPPHMSNKKQKVSGAFLDQSIEQLNDVTAVSGVNLREEEEQLFSGPKEDSRVSEASRRVVQEEEERLILQKIPLQKKLAEIMSKHGLKNISSDVERCLSLCVEERMRGLICNLIRLSKQRIDAEKPRHQTLITSDVRQQIMKINQKAKEDWEKKQAEAEKLRKANEPDSENGGEGDKDKDEGRGKLTKVNKEEDDKMRTTAANVAARAAVGGDDMLSKWQLMAEQARQKREGGTDTASGSQSSKDANRKPLSTHGRKDNQEAGKRNPATHASASGAVRKFGRNQHLVPQLRVARTITVKDVIAVLEREPQMSKSTLIYRLYEKVRSDAPAEQ